VKILLQLLLLTFLLDSCKIKTENDLLVIPTDSSTLYFPIFDSAKAVKLMGSVSMDSAIKMWDSRELFDFREPVLYNYTGKIEVYRFTWVRNQAYPVCIRLQKQNDSITLITKINDGYAYSRGKLILNQVKSITKNEWDMFNLYLKGIDFWNLDEEGIGCGTDAAGWILEGVSGGKYHWASRCDPDWNDRYPNFTKTCKYLISLSGIDFEKKD
jgi:hypothetical protein